MTTALQFSELINLINTICNNPIPEKLFIRYRCEYEYILSQICLGNHQNCDVHVNYLLEHVRVGSQPTLLKRLNELEQLNLIQQKDCADKRLRSFELTELGRGYLEKCGECLLLVARPAPKLETREP